MDLELWKQVKKNKKLTLQDISDISNIPKRTVDDIFSGKTTNPRIDTVKAIELALGIKEEQTKDCLTSKKKEIPSAAPRQQPRRPRVRAFRG